MQTLIAYVENKPGVLNRVSSLARRLAINIDSLTVGPTENEEVARMTIVAHTDERGAHRLEASLEKLVDVLLAENVSERSLLERDLALIKVSADQKSRPHLMELIKVFRARVIDVAPESLILEVSGTVDKIDGLLEVLRPFGVLEMAQFRPHQHDPRSRPATAASGVAISAGATRFVEAQMASYGRSTLLPSSANNDEVIELWFFFCNIALTQLLERFRFSHQKRTEDTNGKSLLRRFRRPGSDPGQKGRDHRLRLAGPRACAEPEGLRRRRARRPARRQPLDGAKRRSGGLAVITPAEAAQWADVIMILAPDTTQPQALQNDRSRRI